MSSQCDLAGRPEAAVGYSHAAQLVIGDVPCGVEAAAQHLGVLLRELDGGLRLPQPTQ